MKELILALAIAVALTGCASNTARTSDSDASVASAEDTSETKFKTVCTKERSTGSRTSSRTCRKVPVAE